MADKEMHILTKLGRGDLFVKFYELYDTYCKCVLILFFPINLIKKFKILFSASWVDYTNLSPYWLIFELCLTDLRKKMSTHDFTQSEIKYVARCLFDGLRRLYDLKVTLFIYLFYKKNSVCNPLIKLTLKFSVLLFRSCTGI